MNGQKNLLAIIIAVVITACCCILIPESNNKKLEANYETALQQNKDDYEKQVKSLETQISALTSSIDDYKAKAEEPESKAETNSSVASSGSSSKNSSSAASKGGTKIKADSHSSNDTTYTYILNKNTGEFHYSWCGSVSQMKESNKIYSNSSRDDIVESGYAPCKKCKP